MTLLHIENLQCLDLGPVSLSLGSGECVCVSGASGAGKTLLLRSIADLDPHSGHVDLDGSACESMPATQWRSKVGLLPAESFWWSSRVGDHFGSEGLPILERLAFSRDVLGWDVERLSTGERQRLSLVRLLANRPRVLLLDEPTANLDPDNAQRVESVLQDYRLAEQAALLWVSHDRHQIARVAQRHVSLESGQLHAVEREPAQ